MGDKGTFRMNDIWTRRQAETEPSELLDAAKSFPQIVEDTDGRFVLTFERGVKRSVKEWAASPGGLEDDDEL